MKIAIITFQLIETAENIDLMSSAEKEKTKSHMLHSERVQISHVFASEQKCAEYFRGFVDKYRSTIV